jgi:small-conductance mechanosensitive channel
VRNRQKTIDAVARAREHDWKVALPTGAIAIASLIGGGAFGNVHGSERQQIIVWAAAVAVLAFGIVATRRAAAALGQLVAAQSILSAGAAVRLIASGVGYVIVIFAEFGLLSVSLEHLLVGAGLAGVVLGIAAQQSLSNVFAAIVLLFARPFVVGDRIRIRSGALGGIFEATVVGISLTYVTLTTDDGPLKIPNSVMLATAVGPINLTDQQLTGGESHH